MSDKKLDLILEKLGTLDEVKQIVTAMRSNLELTNAKLEALTVDVRRVEGNSIRIEKKLDEQLNDLRGDYRFLNHRVADLEMDMEKLKQRLTDKA